MTERRPTAADRKVLAQYHFLAENLRGLEEDLRWGLEGSPRIPEEWHRIAQTQAAPFKTHVTMRIDDDVVAFFKAMGRGHQTRMNAVLRAFMQARLAGVVKGAEDVRYQLTPLETYQAEVEGLVDHIMLRNIRVRAGKGLESDEVEISDKTLRLRLMEDELDLPDEERIVGLATGAVLS